MLVITDGIFSEADSEVEKLRASFDKDGITTGAIGIRAEGNLPMFLVKILSVLNLSQDYRVRFFAR